jgi:hypothetical protein
MASIQTATGDYSLFREVTSRGLQSWGLGELAFALYCCTANVGLLLANNFVLAILGDAYSNLVKPAFQQDDMSLWEEAAQAATWLWGWLARRWNTRLLRLRPKLLHAAPAAATVASPSSKLMSIRRSTFGASQKRQISYAARAAVLVAQRASASHQSVSLASTSTTRISAAHRRCAALLKTAVDVEERAEYFRGVAEDPHLSWAARSVERLAEPVDGVCRTYGVWTRLDEEAHAKRLRQTLRLAPVLRAARSVVARRLQLHRQLHTSSVRVQVSFRRYRRVKIQGRGRVRIGPLYKRTLIVNFKMLLLNYRGFFADWFF